MNTGVLKTKKVSMTVASKERRKRVIKRLEQQLKSKVKTTIEKTDSGYAVKPLEEHDIERINKEINILKQRI